jgi:hypothetical protein
MHYLMVSSFEVFGGKKSSVGFERWIEHEDECSTEIRDLDPISGNHWHGYTCGVGYWEENYGFVDLEDDLRFNTPGKYKIDFYNYTPKSYFEDADCYLYFVEEDLVA